MSRKLTRRAALMAPAIGMAFGRTSLSLAAGATDRRFVVVLLRGGLDGLSVVVPYGDKDLLELRAPLVPPSPGSPNGLLDLGGFYGLNPALSGLHGLYAANEALLIHAVAGPYRVRSHFDAQDFMEAGASQRLPSGWLNRVAGLLPAGGATDSAMAMGYALPPLLRGPAPVANWAPPIWPEAPPDLYARLIAMHRHDPVTLPAFVEGLKERRFTNAVLAGNALPPGTPPFTVLADRAGRFLAAADGPRLASLELEGWDTHEAQPVRLWYALRQLDDGLMALKASLGDAWAKTAVLVMTEFGRTARVNGSGGTDHGTATVALVLGGAVAGGRVQADWPGLGSGRLFEDRDLQPTLDINAVARSILSTHIAVSDADLATVFPDSVAAAPLHGIMRA